MLTSLLFTKALAPPPPHKNSNSVRPPPPAFVYEQPPQNFGELNSPLKII